MARRKKDGGGAGEGANWMDTYGDMVTLLLTFFVLLFSMSTIDEVKWEALVGALSGTGNTIIPVMDIQSAVDAPIKLEINTATTRESKDPSDPDSSSEERDLQIFWELVNNLQTFINENDLNAELHPDPDTLTVIMRVTDNVFFDSGDATIKQVAYEILDELAQLFADNMPLISTVDIEGHTDTDPISNAMYTDNWDLSAKRATNTVRFLLRNEGVDETKLTPKGLSEFHPVAPNDTPQGKAANRRVDFVIQSITSM
ncbi:MAG: OmpA family protein [Oscillospiraceae bacterium]|nr:OmpA family protein [Oscillospiraceae bacterium]